MNRRAFVTVSFYLCLLVLSIGFWVGTAYAVRVIMP